MRPNSRVRDHSRGQEELEAEAKAGSSKPMPNAEVWNYEAFIVTIPTLFHKTQNSAYLHHRRLAKGVTCAVFWQKTDRIEGTYYDFV